ncbi:hypothetical protein RAB80_013274 [Fusarium oxysporum f. sp. vasinfectum]|uniref:Uncharacterized protein n=2 Tax=Fusarium oxysporum f. sp. vasinfectum 25433 TaxID=1089449 RepID=X0M180_FUSOX|nr:hypothetical protein FOTG_06525 [Fusarium oxysporum f. sp. vasinfectum 25433]EXM27127.1 hypothetical protein FOTG_06525 [Fusarium oxysporum f. sp. vasinfectum 25433]EXM27128.1 hypothetical protein FOTG_06525 [Fusarium oxysporum f. sp. vasinfectum 25433]KAK2670852.1 hypothetical protein RAB80_013274 [Fusarium oxysporum f. sp. vasinfectum]KAK2927303.1 hypothetical protein FoTM2_012477 [Fusarium oxysporum f. sp. vasinfectum]
MEQQDPDTPSTPSAVHRDTEHRSTRQSPSASSSTFSLTPAPQRRTSSPFPRPTKPATPGPSTISSNRSSLSTSEPTLRFPRPQGNRHLANWISSSNPDIMRITTTTEDTGLSESTYELISGTDTESQDGNYTESISESVGSLDVHYPEDVHSLAGTEQTYDDESLADENEPPVLQSVQEPQAMSVSESMDINETPQAEQSWASVVKNGPLPEVEAEIEAEEEPEPHSAAKAEPESESEDEARSRSSLEYTQQSLKTPSIPSPDASMTEDSQKPSPDDIQEQAESQRARFNKWLKEVQPHPIRPREAMIKFAKSIFPAVLALVLMSLIRTCYTPLSKEVVPHIPAATSAVTTHPTLLTSSYTSLPTLQILSTSAGPTGLVPLENLRPDEWLWGGKQPEVTVTKQRGGFLIHMPRSAKKLWLDRDCLKFDAKRGDQSVGFGTSSVDEGILLKIPKEEAHGTIKVDIFTTCRPKVHKVLRITFQKGIISEALDSTWAFAQYFPELVPAAAQEAERCLEEAKRSLGTASDNFMNTSDSVFKNLGHRFQKAHRSLSWIKTDIRDRAKMATESISRQLEAVAGDVKQYIPDAQGMQQQAKLELLNAQIRARLWWLKYTAGEKEYTRYQCAAKQFMAKTLSNDRELRKTTNKTSKTSAFEQFFRAWSSKNRRDTGEGQMV